MREFSSSVKEGAGMIGWLGRRLLWNKVKIYK
jgi:hypothetical protein